MREMYINYTFYERDGMSLEPFIGSTPDDISDNYILTNLEPKSTGEKTKEELIRLSTQPVQHQTRSQTSTIIEAQPVIQSTTHIHNMQHHTQTQITQNINIDVSHTTTTGNATQIESITENQKANNEEENEEEEDKK